MARANTSRIQTVFPGRKKPAGLKGDTFIEQMYGAAPNPYFATVYSKAKRSPVYSAYRVLPADAISLSTWGRPNIRFQEFGGDPGHNAIYSANTNAKGVTHITRGHLNPSCINSYDADAMESTFIYSNAVPQYEDSNNVVWSAFEQKLVTYAKTKCGTSGGTLYLLTGPADFNFDGNKKVALSSTAPTEIQDASGNKLPVPPVLWTAGCCWKGPGLTAEGLGVIGTNKQAGSATHDVGLKDLQALLGGTPLFPGDVNGECVKASAGPF